MLRTRTHLTTPPGGAPVTEAGDDSGFELYTPGLELPQEPKVPMRNRRQVVGIAVLVLAVVAAWVAFQLVTAGQDFDPSLDENVPGQQDQEFDPTVPLPDEG